MTEREHHKKTKAQEAALIGAYLKALEKPSL